MFSASPALAILERVLCSICCLTGALAALATKAKYLKKVLNSSSVMGSIGSFWIGFRIAFNLASMSLAPKIKNGSSQFRSNSVKLGTTAQTYLQGISSVLNNTVLFLVLCSNKFVFCKQNCIKKNVKAWDCLYKICIFLITFHNMLVTAIAINGRLNFFCVDHRYVSPMFKSLSAKPCL